MTASFHFRVNSLRAVNIPYLNDRSDKVYWINKKQPRPHSAGWAVHSLWRGLSAAAIVFLADTVI